MHNLSVKTISYSAFGIPLLNITLVFVHSGQCSGHYSSFVKTKCLHWMIKCTVWINLLHGSRRLHCATRIVGKPFYKKQVYTDLLKVGFTSKNKCVAGKTFSRENICHIMWSTTARAENASLWAERTSNFSRSTDEKKIGELIYDSPVVKLHNVYGRHQ